MIVQVLNTAVLTAILVFVAFNTNGFNSKFLEFEKAVVEQFHLRTEFLSRSPETAIEINPSLNENAGNLTQSNTARVNASSLAAAAPAEGLFNASSLFEMENEARELFRRGRFLQAGNMYKTISETRPDNRDARFYYLYALFLNNRMDRNNYSTVKEGFLSLERNGYSRAEIRQVLDFIESEESAFISRGLQ